MSYTVFGKLGSLGKVVALAKGEEALAEACMMTKAGFEDVRIRMPYAQPMTLAGFRTQERRLADAACETCIRGCAGEFGG